MDSRFFLKLLVHGTGLLSLKLRHWLYLDQILLEISVHPFRIILILCFIMLTYLLIDIIGQVTRPVVQSQHPGHSLHMFGVIARKL